jgi:hypothetical protein
MIFQDKITVGTTPTDLMPGVDLDRSVEVRIVPDGGVVYIGDDAVTTSHGMILAPALVQPFHMHGEHLFGVTSSGTVDVRVLVLGL